MSTSPARAKKAPRPAPVTRADVVEKLRQCERYDDVADSLKLPPEDYLLMRFIQRTVAAAVTVTRDELVRELLAQKQEMKNLSGTLDVYRKLTNALADQRIAEKNDAALAEAEACHVLQ